MLFQYITLILVGFTMSIPYNNKDDLTGRIETDLARQSEAIYEERSSNKDFWDNIYQNSILNTKTRYNTLSGEKVCFTCPIDRSTFTSLFHKAAKTANTPGEAPPRITIAWSTQLSENRMIFFCRNNTRMSSAPIFLGSDNENGQQADFGTVRGGGDGGELDYSCENDRLCLINLRHNYPENYQCLVKSYVLNVRLNVIVQLQYVILYFAGDSVKFDYQKEVQVYENHMFTVKCEVPETNPVSNVNAYIDGKELKLTKLEKKTIDNRMSINTYSFEINATRDMNNKRVKCEASMKDIPSELANSIDLRSYISKDYTLSVYYLPTCVYPTRVYKTGINRTIVIECPINSSNPDVTYYKMIPPSTRTSFELIDNSMSTLSKMGRYRITPNSRADFGLYECIPRSLAGTTKCDINVELGATPNPPEQCIVQFAFVNNKTFAQFSCKPGFNQGGLSSFLTIYEVNLNDRELKLSGRVNIDEGKLNQEVPFITPADEEKYYEFLIMQENNYGNSTSILLHLGTNKDPQTVKFWENKSTIMIGFSATFIAFILLICCCCCLSDLFSSKSDNPFCKCCSPSEQSDDDGSTYKKAPLDAVDTITNGGTMNKPFQGFNSKFGTTSLVNQSNYEYYDNTSTGLLSETYSRKYMNATNSHHVKKSHSYDETNEEDNAYSNDDDDEKQDHYTIAGSKQLKNYADSGEESTSSSTNDKKNILIEQNNYFASKINKPKKISYSANKDILDNYNKNLKQQQQLVNQSKASSYLNTNTYSTIDSQKFIKTENGLVYTSLNGVIKSTDALMIEEEADVDNTSKLKEEIYEEEKNNQQRNNAKISSTYSDVKKSTQPLTNKAIFSAPPNQNNFKNELSLKLKTINTSKELAESTANTTNSTLKKPYTNEQISTATTSLSSASSCTSNSEMLKDTNTLNKRLAPLACDLTESVMDNTGSITATSNANSNKAYSLIKTTLNGSNEQNEFENTNQSENGLRKSQTKLNGSVNCVAKPPILKPKPRTNNFYQQNTKKLMNSTFDSIHNQSGEQLLNNISNFKETSLHTSPSTSVTDISSTNCTPQHYNANLLDDITSAQLNNLVKQNNSSTLQRMQTRQTQSGTLKPTSKKAITTFTTAANVDGLIYSTTKLSGDLITSYTNSANINGTLRTFNHNFNSNNNNNNNNTYEFSTLNKKINLKKSQEDILNNKSTSSINNLNKSNDLSQRTLEKRHIQNSEC